MEAMAEYNILQDILPPQCQIKLRIGIDNQAAYIMETSLTYSRRTLHIELRWHYVREQVQKGVIDLHKVKGEEKPADMFTKPFDKNLLRKMKCSSCVVTMRNRRVLFEEGVFYLE